MNYQYADLRHKVFEEDTQPMFLKIRDTAKRLTNEAGAVSCERLIRGCSGDGWTMLACVDRLVELGELVELPNPVSRAALHRIFIAPYQP